MHAGMAYVPGGTFRMGSDRHYPEEIPSHLVTVDGFWIDATPVTNRQFAEFVRATGHITFAETVPDPKDYPGSLPHLIFAGSLAQKWPAPGTTIVRAKKPACLRAMRNFSDWVAGSTISSSRP